MNKSINFASIFLLFTLSSHQFLLHVASSNSPIRSNQGFADERTLKSEQEHVHEVHCSRERSRAARKVIEEYLTPFLEKEKYQLSSKCRLHPENDMFRDQEEHKICLGFHDWQCGYCKKSFQEEKFLDQHFDNRHSNLLNSSDGRCLADLCGALHCDTVMSSKSSRNKCNPAAATRNKHLCESLAESCFPVSDGPSASRLHEIFLHQFCEAHTCSGKQKPFSRGGKVQKSLFVIVSGALILVILPLFYLFLYLVQRDMKSSTQELRRISKMGRKTKPS
ncbi:hypothetical protein PIB30_025394 [Stylosanthes scabra]|uniref:C2H2-type domain-containing protein n=1 Tax=Stylosanthes scabra TaxID=79078 RepID=A0ABU6Q9M3_9FABA|nr:hypothetical protein [Stylosanthes scabra]